MGIQKTWNHENEKKIGKVWFTVSVTFFDPSNEPTFQAATAKMTSPTAPVSTDGIAPGIINNFESIKSIIGAKKDGVYADGRCLVVRGIKHSDGAYELYFAVSPCSYLIIKVFWIIASYSVKVDEVINPDGSLIRTSLPIPAKR